MVLFTSENNDIANQSVNTSFFTSEKNRMTNQLASLVRRDYFYLDASWRVNLGMCIIIIIVQRELKGLYSALIIDKAIKLSDIYKFGMNFSGNCQFSNTEKAKKAKTHIRYIW